ncbi:hypothetical protein M422DRAFT_27474 [Sphaerobolus stellatus SS14]|nr:hypothetical protein M422DRAFT_27474 [Sphaerobolus stellatus SS14]
MALERFEPVEESDPQYRRHKNVKLTKTMHGTSSRISLNRIHTYCSVAYQPANNSRKATCHPRHCNLFARTLDPGSVDRHDKTMNRMRR